MKIILSRKGFDSAAGGVPSPILPDGQMISLPIPDKRSSIAYSDIKCDGVDLGRVVSELTRGRIRSDFRAHLDPDIRRGSMSRAAGWRPVFGQCGHAQGHLRNCGVSAGDIFLFFGLFRQVTIRGGQFAWAVGSRPLHIIWGWLQVGEIIAVDGPASVPAWARYHPHCAMEGEKNNVLYVAARDLALPGCVKTRLQGSGVFNRFARHLQLSDPKAARHGEWRLPVWMFPGSGKTPMTFHADLSRWARQDGATLLRCVSRGQEFVLGESDYPELSEWVMRMVGIEEVVAFRRRASG